MPGPPSYLDCNASTPILPEVVEVVTQTMGMAGNPSSSSHRAGRSLAYIVEGARHALAEPVGRAPREVVFTSGATESNNLAIVGTAVGSAAGGVGGAPGHIVTTAFEHASVRRPIDHLEAQGWSVTRLQAGPDGRFCAEALARAMRPETTLVSVMEVNNETGVVQPIAEAARIVASHRQVGGEALLHVDGAQGFTKTRPSYEGVDLLSVSGHKLHGPVGIGALFVSDRAYGRLRPLMHGGHHQGGLRPGTLPAALIAGLGEAVRIGFEQRQERLKARRDFQERACRALVAMGAEPNLVSGSETVERIHTTFNLRFPGLDAEVVLMRWAPFVAMSRGAACNGDALSPVLAQLGLSETEIQSSIRASWCHVSEEPDWGAMAAALKQLRGAKATESRVSQGSSAASNHAR